MEKPKPIRPFLRFPFSKLDRERSETILDAVQIKELPIGSPLQLAWAAAQPESLTIESPVAKDWSPRLSPMFPGDLTFIADPDQDLPKPEAVTIVSSA